MALDANISVLIANTVTWEKFAGADRYSDESYAAAVQVPCRIEAGVDAVRGSDGVVFVPKHLLIFDANDTRVASFTLRDRFTVPAVTDDEPLQPKTITPIYGPDGDQWVVEVTLA